MKNAFDGLMSLREAADRWGIDDSTLRKAVTNGKLTDGEDVKKFGKQWIITTEAMERVFGKPAE